MENKGEVIIYQTADNQTQIEVKLEEDTVWLTQAQIVALFQCSKANISEHTKHFFLTENLKKNKLFGNSERFELKVRNKYREIGTLQS
jgi:hypothetical protein